MRDTGLLAEVTAWLDADVDEDDRAELRALVALATSDDPGDLTRRRKAREELHDRFDGGLVFGTAGLRGAMAAGPNRMNRAVVIRAAHGLADFLAERLRATGDGAPSVVVGYDARHRSKVFALDTAAVLTAAGCAVRLLPGPLPTPVLAFAVRNLGADAGVMVTASHNPAADNGYKVYLGGRVVLDSGQGVQIVPPYDAAIAQCITAAPAARDVPRAADGWTVLGSEIVDRYCAAVGALGDSQPRTIDIVTTALHGVGGHLLSRILAEAGFDSVTAVPEQQEPDPDFPTVSFPNPEEAGALDAALALAQERGANLVIANDPDADRCAVAVPDPRLEPVGGTDGATGWRILHGDEVGALLGEEIAASREGDSEAVLARSIVSSRLLDRIARHYGLSSATTLTGFKWISRTPHLVYGYEEALGYCVAPQIVRDKDGLSAALMVAQLANRLAANGRTVLDLLDDLARRHGLHLTSQVSLRFSSPADIAAALDAIRRTPPASLGGSPVIARQDLGEGLDGLPPTDGIRFLAADDTLVTVRPSGTEPKLKAYLEVIIPVEAQAPWQTVTQARSAGAQRLQRVDQDIRAALAV